MLQSIHTCIGLLSIGDEVTLRSGARVIITKLVSSADQCYRGKYYRSVKILAAGLEGGKWSYGYEEHPDYMGERGSCIWWMGDSHKDLDIVGWVHKPKSYCGYETKCTQAIDDNTLLLL